MSKKIDLTRREFLLKSALLSASSVAAPFALNLFSMRSAMASPQTGYKALVCLYLAGGNDHNNTVIATDTATWPTTGVAVPTSFGGYTSARGGSIGFTLAALANTAIATPVGGKEKTLNTTVPRTYALHPSLGKYDPKVTGSLKDMYDAGQVAIVPNVGTLVEPIADWRYYRGTLGTVTRPTNLFSHSDQTNQWVNTYPGTTKANFGWGGRIADKIYTNNGSHQQFTSLSLTGNNTFLAGEFVNQIQINSNGVPVDITKFKNIFGSIDANPTVTNFTQTVVSPNAYSTNKFEIEHANIVAGAIAADTDLQTVMTNTASTVAVPTQYVQPNSAAGAMANNPIAVQLQTVARIIAGRTTLTASRQIFFVSVGGFDTHTTQATNQSDLLARVSHAIDYFYNTALKTLPGGDQTNNVTLFTASDFGRTLTSNGSGTDHGWGSHHFVVGGNGVTAGPVKGGDIYGAFPQTFVSTSNAWGNANNNPLDVGSGNYIPQISVDQYSATLAKWFGLDPATEIPLVFPNLNNFSIANDPTGMGIDLGFMV